MRPYVVLLRFLALCGIALLSLYGSSSNANPSGNERANIFDPNRFIFPTSQEVGKTELLQCPNHLFGTRQKGLEELRKRLLAKSSDKPALIEICVYCQPESMLLYAPKMDWVGLNPFATAELKFTAPNVEAVELKSDSYWAESVHPILTRLGLLNSTTPENCRLLARVDLAQKEPGLWEKRPPSLDELRWCMVALCGAGYNGIIWVGKSDKNALLTSAIEKEFKPIGAAIVNVKPINDHLESKGVYATLLESPDKYVLCVLSKDYVKIGEAKAGSSTISVSSALDEMAAPFQIVLKDTESKFLTRPAAQMLVSKGEQKSVAWRVTPEGLVLDSKLVGPANILIWDKTKD